VQELKRMEIQIQEYEKKKEDISNQIKAIEDSITKDSTILQTNKKSIQENTNLLSKNKPS
jgi:hypothetical protein